MLYNAFISRKQTLNGYILTFNFIMHLLLNRCYAYLSLNFHGQIFFHSHAIAQKP